MVQWGINYCNRLKYRKQAIEVRLFELNLLGESSNNIQEPCFKGLWVWAGISGLQHHLQGSYYLMWSNWEAQLPVGSSTDYCQVNDIERKYGISKAAILISFSTEQWCWVKKNQKIQICSVALANVPQMRAKNEKCMKPSSMGPRSLWQPVS